MALNSSGVSKTSDRDRAGALAPSHPGQLRLGMCLGVRSPWAPWKGPCILPGSPGPPAETTAAFLPPAARCPAWKWPLPAPGLPSCPSGPPCTDVPAPSHPSSQRVPAVPPSSRRWEGAEQGGVQPFHPTPRAKGRAQPSQGTALGRGDPAASPCQEYKLVLVGITGARAPREEGDSAGGQLPLVGKTKKNPNKPKPQVIWAVQGGCGPRCAAQLEPGASPASGCPRRGTDNLNSSP